MNSNITQLAYLWLALPKNEDNFNYSIYDFESPINDSEVNAKGTYEVVFNKPYKTAPATPAVWYITMDYIVSDLVLDGRLRYSISDLTAMGFKLTIEMWGNMRYAGNVWGWCAWDKEYDGVKVKAEVKVVCYGNANELLRAEQQT